MAILGYRRARSRPQYAQRLYTVAVRAHALVARAWPRPRGGAKTTHAQIQQQRFKNRAGWRKVLKEHELRPMREALQRFAKRHVGLKGSSITRQRDIEDIRLAGRLYAIKVPGLGTFWPEAAAQDVSDVLDWLEPVHGGVLTRTQDTWLTAIPCTEGARLTLTIDPPVPNCCEPAREATKREAVDSSI